MTTTIRPKAFGSDTRVTMITEAPYARGNYGSEVTLVRIPSADNWELALVSGKTGTGAHAWEVIGSTIRSNGTPTMDDHIMTVREDSGDVTPVYLHVSRATKDEAMADALGILARYVLATRDDETTEYR